MKQTVYLSDFRDAFRRAGRDNQFSYEGLEALYDWLIACEDGTCEEFELDVIALCCEWSEYSSLEEFQQDYGDDYESMDDVEDRTTVIRIDDNRFIIATF
jgi:hypothetical protein